MKSHYLLLLLLVALTALGTGCADWDRRHRAVEHYAAALALKDGDFEEDAVVQLREAVRVDSEFAVAQSLLGDIYKSQGRYDRAAEAFENACRVNPWSFHDHLNLGEVYRFLERFADAIVVLRRACQLEPESPQANLQLGLSYYDIENYDLAAAFCSRAADLDPTNETIHAALGDIHGKSGEDYHAIRAYKQALELDPNQPEVMISLGMVYVRMGRFGPAEFIINKAQAADPESSKPHVALGYARLCQHDTIAKDDLGQRQQFIDQALASYKTATDLDPDCIKAYNGIGVTHMVAYIDNPSANGHHVGKAIDAWHYSLEVDPEQPKIKAFVEKYGRLLKPASSDESPPEHDAGY